MSERFCRVCGCTQNRACVDETGPCSWTDDDLCSHCVKFADMASGLPTDRLYNIAERLMFLQAHNDPIRAHQHALQSAISVTAYAAPMVPVGYVATMVGGAINAYLTDIALFALVEDVAGVAGADEGSVN